VPVSKKRKKKRDNRPSRPPVSKQELATRKKKLSTRQILIYVFSALIILSLAISFIVSSNQGAVPQGQPNASGSDPASIQATPTPLQGAIEETDPEGADSASPDAASPGESEAGESSSDENSSDAGNE
jgi:cytoskeletal protein RodZ